MAIVIGRSPLLETSFLPQMQEEPAAEPPHPRLIRLAREVGAEDEVVIPLHAKAAPSRHRSYWYHFTNTMDHPQDVAILKELVFWASVRHQDDTLLRVIHLCADPHDFLYHQRAFGVTESPCLIMSDRDYFPATHIKLNKGLFDPGVMGSDYSALRNLLETMHSLLNAHGSLSSLSEDLLQARIATGMEKVWTEMRGLVKLNVAPAS